MKIEECRVACLCAHATLHVLPVATPQAQMCRRTVVSWYAFWEWWSLCDTVARPISLNMAKHQCVQAPHLRARRQRQVEAIQRNGHPCPCDSSICMLPCICRRVDRRMLVCVEHTLLACLWRARFGTYVQIFELMPARMCMHESMCI